ncbi:MAG: ABC transporter permease [Desulfarculaceae bacterium]|nr:ABC transporter permease [Desulfarculaceae bacterium]MCF8073222.1 ABC transporter permease [Desulfarculaceae bacterium]MCF8100818.1 ABC transporter permease [Desulfarculaceae bacterium]MCF8117744.1 ABC transporter permease [Desulfarculaceae bacterium]
MAEHPAGSGRVWAGALLLILLAGAVLAAPWLCGQDPLRMDLGARLQPPGPAHWLGTDQLGRDQLARLLHGGRVSLMAGLAASGAALLLGLAWGVAAGLTGRTGDFILMRAADVGLAFPGLLLALVLVGVWQGGVWTLVVALALTGWAWWARLARGLLREAQGREFVLGGRALGVGPWRLLANYLLPQMWPPLAVAAAMKTGWIIVALSALGYLGLGIQPPAPEWGAMLQQSRLYMSRAPWLMLVPGGAVFLVVLACNLIAEGLRRRWQIREVRWL